MRGYATICPTHPGQVEIHISDRGYICDFSLASMVESTEGTVPRYEPLRITREAAQEIMDCLIASGIRPNNGEGGPAQVKALQSHIDDLRTIAFHAIKVPAK